MPINQVNVFRLAIRRKPHDLVFAGIDLESSVIGERGIEQAERMRKFDVGQQFKGIALADAVAGSRPFAHAVNRQNRGFLKRRRKKRGRGVRFVMFGEQHMPVKADFIGDKGANPELLLHPERHGG